MKKSTKNILIGAGIATAVGAIAAAVVYELKLIKKLTTDIDEMSEEEVPMDEFALEDEALEIEIEDAPAEEIVEEIAEEA